MELADVVIELGCASTETKGLPIDSDGNTNPVTVVYQNRGEIVDFGAL